MGRYPTGRQVGPHRPVDDYAQTVSVLSGRCSKWVDDGAGEPTNCPEPVVASGGREVGERWHRVDACGQHSGQLRKRGPLTSPT
jgi:hypothetical protein